MKTLTLVVVLFFSFACEEKKLKELDRLTVKEQNVLRTVNVNFCTMDAQKLRTKLKFVFVLDKSGSNQQRTVDSVVLPGTDMDGHRRYDPILNFVNGIQGGFTQEAPDNDTIHYSLINFARSASLVQNFTNNEENFIDLVMNQKYRNCETPARPYPLLADLPPGCPSDSGFTDYENALNRVITIINQDSQNERDNNPNEIISSHYVVFFITDGAPVVGFNGTDKVIQGLAPIKNIIDDLVKLSQVTNDGTENNSAWIDSIQVHTGYYYSTDGFDEIAQDYLKSMAEDSGRGQAHQFAGSQVIDFSSFKIPERNVEHIFDDILIINQNSVWDGEFLVPDSDGDGLSDELENRLGSNQLNRDSDSNGVSDAVEYRYRGAPCLHASCNAGGAMNYTCTSTERNSDLDNDGLSDCEEIILNSRKELFDTNKDDIPDDLALRYRLGLAPNDPQDAHENKDSDFADNYVEIKADTPINFNNSRILNLVAQKYDLTPTGKNGTRNCYNVKLKDFKEVNNLTGTTSIKVYIREKTVLNDKLYLRTSTKVITRGNSIQFNDDDFVGN